MENNQFKFSTFFWRVSASHMITYFVMGIFAANLLNYEEIFNNSDILRSYDSPWIPAGPALQLIRGLIFSTALWYFKESFLYRKNGWIKLWGLLVGLCILSTSAAPPGSIEGFIYTTVPVTDQLKGYIEVIPQVGLLSFFVCYWYEKPNRAWNIIFGVLVGLIMLMSIMGVLAASGIIQVD